MAARNSFVVIGGQIQRRLESGASSVHGSRCQALRQVVSPLTKIAHGQMRDILLGQALRDVRFHAGHVANVAAPRLNIVLIAIERLRDGKRLTAVGLAASRAGHGSSAFLRLPEIERGAVISVLEIVGGADRLCPIASLASQSGSAYCSAPRDCRNYRQIWFEEKASCQAQASCSAILR
jgi:hypothetical protein